LTTFSICIIHGSVNWIEADGENKLFKVKEIQEPTLDELREKKSIMIHPTPLKYSASLGSPYSDLFREFQKKLMQNNNILVTIGYSFSDEHINNLIFQAFTIPSFRLIVIGEPTDKNAIGNALLYEEYHGNKQIRDYCSSMITRFKSIKEREDFSFLTKNKKKIKKDKYLNEFLGIHKQTKNKQIIIIDLNSANDETVEIISCVLSRMIFEKLKKAEIRNSYPINLILEEAHRYISKDSGKVFGDANKIFDRIAKEGRKYGMFLLVSSQRPSELSKTVLSQCSNFIVHRIQNPEDLSHIRQITPHISETILKRLPSIPTQHALIFGHSVNLPTTFKVNDAEPKPRSDNNKISENWFREKEFKVNIMTQPL